jgi:hypothetical protein
MHGTGSDVWLVLIGVTLVMIVVGLPKLPEILAALGIGTREILAHDNLPQLITGIAAALALAVLWISLLALAA